VNNPEVLGMQKKKFVFSCRGVIPRKDLPYAAKNIIAFIGMTVARDGRVDDYPFQNGGGTGYTGFFPLMESYLIMDAYSDLNETEVLVSTCAPDRLIPEALASYLSKIIGPTIYKGSL
jgi:hypothetical protein